MEVEKKGKVGDKRLAVAADDERTRISKTPVSHFHESHLATMDNENSRGSWNPSVLLSPPYPLYTVERNDLEDK